MAPKQRQKIEIDKTYRDPLPSFNQAVTVDCSDFLGTALIPAHYFFTGLATDASGLESADGWVNVQEKVHHADVRRLDSADLTLNAAELKGSHHRVYYFGNHLEEK